MRAQITSKTLPSTLLMASSLSAIRERVARTASALTSSTVSLSHVCNVFPSLASQPSAQAGHCYYTEVALRRSWLSLRRERAL